MLWMRLNRIVCVISLICAGASLPVRAADPAGVAGPLIDDQTLAVVRVDLQGIDLDALVDRIRRTISDVAGPEAMEQAKGPLEESHAEVGARHKAFVQAGAKDLYAVVSLNDLPGFLAAVPVSAGNREALLNQVQDTIRELQIPAMETYAFGDLVLAGPKETIERIQKRTTTVRSDALAAAFGACAGRTVQAIVIPTADQNRVLAEMLPQVLGGSGARQFAGLKWAALGVDLPPSMALGLTIETAGPDSAEGLLKVLKDVYAWVAQQPDIRSSVPELDQVLADLTPRTQQGRLVLNLDQAHTDALIKRLVGPSLAKARENAQRMACVSYLKQVGLATMIHADEHQGQLPPDLETLIAGAKLPEKCLICPCLGTKDSYAYRGAGLTTKLQPQMTPQMILAHDRSANHKGQGRNVVFLDGHVEWVREERFQQLIQEDNQARVKASLPELPAQ